MDETVAAGSVHERLVSIFRDVFDIELDPTRTNVSRDEIEGWDSISQLRLILEIESVFQISMTDEETARIASLRDIEAVLASRGLGAGD